MAGGADRAIKDQHIEKLIKGVGTSDQGGNIAQALRTAYDEGVLEGKRQAHHELLGLLESEYMRGDFKRGSVEAQAVLHVTRKVGEKLRQLKK